MNRIVYSLLPIICLAIPAGSEVVLFKNGDRLTGDWVRIQEGRLVLKTESLGEVAIPLAKIQSFSTPKRAVAALRDGRVLRGELSLGPSGDWEIMTGQQIRRVPVPSIEAIYPQSVHEPKTLRRALVSWLTWKGSGNFGYSLVRGDRQAGTFSVGMNFSRGQLDLTGLQEQWRTNYALNMLFTNTRAASGARISANSITSALRQDFFLTANNFLFGLVQFDHIQPQGLDFRQTYGFGMGRDLLRRPRASVSLMGGTTFVKERIQNAASRQGSEVLVGEKFNLELSPHVKVTHQFSFYPNLSERGRYRFDTTSTFSTRLAPRLSFHVNFVNRYLSSPPPGRKKNQLVLTTGFGVRIN